MVNNVDKYLDKAYKEAFKAFEKNEVPIGAVIVDKEGKIISRAHNLKETKQSPLSHAEIICIEKACKKIKNWRLDECTMYVTLYPCQMCLGAIKESRICKVYYGAKRDNIDEFDTNTCIYMEDKRCLDIIQRFFKQLRKK